MFAVYRPLKFKTLCSIRNIVIGLLTIAFVSCLFNFYVLWTSKIVDFICYSYATDNNSIFFVIILFVLLYSLVPHALITLIDILIIRKLKKIQLRINKSTTSLASTSVNSNKKSKTKISIQIVFINSFIFLILFISTRIIEFCDYLNPELNINFLLEIFSLLLSSYYSFYFLIQIFIYKNIREMLEDYLKTAREEQSTRVSLVSGIIKSQTKETPF